MNEETARRIEAGDFIVFGAPNVVRGGSHGWTRASDMIARAYIPVLASNYYPAPLLAAFQLGRRHVPLAQAWNLISASAGTGRAGH